MTNADNLSLGEKLYCVLQDVKDYIHCNGLEQDEELDWILSQLEDIKEQYDNERSRKNDERVWG